MELRRFYFDVDPAFHRAMKVYAIQQGMTLGGLLKVACEEYMKNHAKIAADGSSTEGGSK